ncbi:MAG: multicopper oxidase domain-containing protein, partial [Clostridia bacterium]|nr:multicopper oxidase domain-containing protein [Clostridia bacterium]
MNNKGVIIFLNVIVLGLIGLSVFSFSKLYLNQKGQQAGGEVFSIGADKYAYLTTGNLRSLPPLPETLKLVPTGQTREFTLEAKESQWEVLPGVKTTAVTYNGKTPGPEIKVTEGDLVRVTLKNSLKAATSIHFHGMHLPNEQDGVPPFTQKSVEPGETFTYEFIAGHAGTYMYHPHINSVEQIDKGLYGAFVIEPQDKAGYPRYDKEYTMVLAGWKIPSDSYDPGALRGVQATGGDQGGHSNMEGMEDTSADEATAGNEHEGMEGMEQDSGESNSMAMDYNFWTINGKAFPATEKIKVKEGERVRLRLVNISNSAHPMHLHGTDFRIIAEDSHPLA